MTTVRGAIHYEIDDSELKRAIIDMSGAPLRLQLGITKVMRTKVGPLLSDEMKVDATGHLGNWFGKPGTSYVTPLPRAITWEMLSDWEVESGFEPRGVGLLAPIIVLGSPRNAPAYDYTAALRRVTPIAADWLADVAEDSVFGEERG